ncbi:MAG: OmpA family protein, partial [Bacteroidota bacterium]
DVLCSRDLNGILNFHQENRHTALDWELCEMAACLWAATPNPLLTLSEGQQDQLDDMFLMLELRNALLSTCTPEQDSLELIKTVAGLARRYPYHRAPWIIGTATLNYFACNHRYDWARRALDTLQPLFPDSIVCDYSFVFQAGKQQWLNNYRNMLDRYEDDALPSRIPQRVTAWNTPQYNEYSLVSYGNTKEVFFMRSELSGGAARVMQSEYKKGTWTQPRAIEELYLSNDMELLSIGKKGRKLLMRSKGQLFQAYREEIGRKWYPPRAMKLGGRVADYGWLSDDDSLLYLAVYEHRPDASWRPHTDLAVAKLSDGEQYRTAMPLSELVNIPDYTEQRPVAALGGRMVFFTSDRLGGMGHTDMYRVNYRQPGDWSSAEDVMNLGLTINTVDDDEGITYFSEYGGNAYYHSAGCCGDDLDIWEVNLGAELFPDALRLAGLVLDENGNPLRGGFLEFTPNFQLNVHAMPISKDGTYVYTVPDSTAVVRLFPEIPGYYSERDTTHHLAETARGEIIRDTFVLTSFEYIRQNFKLKHSTFFNGTAQFDQPTQAYPEITRLAKIAKRMGAELDLIGHTDDFGTKEENLRLSVERAESVKQFLVEKCGFDPNRIHTAGRGSTEPVASNTTEEGRRQNRRIDIGFRMPELEVGEQEAIYMPSTRAEKEIDK